MKTLSMLACAVLLAGALALTGCTGEAGDDDLDTAGYGTGADTTGYGSGSLGTGTTSADTTGLGTGDTAGLGVDTTMNDTGATETAP